MNRQLKRLVKKLRTDRRKGTFWYWTNKHMTPPWVNGTLILTSNISDESIARLKKAWFKVYHMGQDSFVTPIVLVGTPRMKNKRHRMKNKGHRM